MIWTNQLRRAVISELERASYAQEGDFYRFLQQGVTLQEIGILDYVRTQLRTHPYLQEKDFLEKSISMTTQEKILGGLRNFRSLIGVPEPTFQSWLSRQDIAIGLAIPYWLYEHFAEEIKEDFINNHLLREGLSIELNGGRQFRCIELKGVARGIVPSNNLELAVIASMLLVGNYKFICFDGHNSILTLHNVSNDYDVDIEISCFASRLTGKTPKAVCVIDDHELGQSQKVYQLQDFIRN